MQKTKEMEKIFKFLWPDKCWHIMEHLGKDAPFPYWGCKICSLSAEDIGSIGQANPDLTDPSNTFMILDRLVEMGYEWSIDSKGRKGSETYVYIVKPDPADPYIYDEFCVSANADTAPLAVISAVESLIRKEEEGK